MELTTEQKKEMLKEAKRGRAFVIDKCFMLSACDDNEIKEYFKDNINYFPILKKNIYNKEYLNKFCKTVLNLYNDCLMDDIQEMMTEKNYKLMDIEKNKQPNEINKYNILLYETENKILSSPFDVLEPVLKKIEYNDEYYKNKINNKNYLVSNLKRNFETIEKLEILNFELDKEYKKIEIY